MCTNKEKYNLNKENINILNSDLYKHNNTSVAVGYYKIGQKLTPRASRMYLKAFVKAGGGM